MDTQTLSLLTCSVSVVINACLFALVGVLIYTYDREAVLEYLYNKPKK